MCGRCLKTGKVSAIFVMSEELVLKSLVFCGEPFSFQLTIFFLKEDYYV
jgi:hypothetical protein